MKAKVHQTKATYKQLN